MNQPFYRDIRCIQISFMGVLFSYGVLAFDFSLLWTQIVVTFVAGLLTQFFWIKKFKLKTNSLLSATITCLSLALLLRSGIERMRAVFTEYF